MNSIKQPVNLSISMFTRSEVTGGKLVFNLSLSKKLYLESCSLEVFTTVPFVRAWIRILAPCSPKFERFAFPKSARGQYEKIDEDSKVQRLFWKSARQKMRRKDGSILVQMAWEMPLKNGLSAPIRVEMYVLSWSPRRAQVPHHNAPFEYDRGCHLNPHPALADESERD